MAATPALQRRFWARSKRIALWLLLAWLLVSLAVPWFASDLHAFQGFGFPLGFWLAAQGALLVYLVIIVVDIIVMERLEACYRQDAAASAHGTADAGASRVVADADAGADADADARAASPR